jgi:hypothetical protein
VSTWRAPCCCLCRKRIHVTLRAGSTTACRPRSRPSSSLTTSRPRTSRRATPLATALVRTCSFPATPQRAHASLWGCARCPPARVAASLRLIVGLCPADDGRTSQHWSGGRSPEAGLSRAVPLHPLSGQPRKVMLLLPDLLGFANRIQQQALRHRPVLSLGGVQ